MSQKKISKLKAKVTRAENQHKNETNKLINRVKNTPVLKSDREWYQQRVRTVSVALLNGTSPGKILDDNPEWGYSYDTFRNGLLQDARFYLSQQIVHEEKDLKIDLTAKYHHLYALNMERNDLREARAVLDSMSRLLQTLESKIQILGNIQTIQLVEVRDNTELDAGQTLKLEQNNE